MNTKHLGIILVKNYNFIENNCNTPTSHVLIVKNGLN